MKSKFSAAVLKRKLRRARGDKSDPHTRPAEELTAAQKRRRAAVDGANKKADAKKGRTKSFFDRFKRS